MIDFIVKGGKTELFGGLRKMSKNNKIRKFLRQIVEESVNETLGVLIEDERGRQDRITTDTDALNKTKKTKSSGEVDEAEDQEEEASEESEEVDSEEKKGPSKGTKHAEDGKRNIVLRPEEVTEVDVYDIIEMLNLMRSGKSLKDDETRKKIEAYFDGLDPGERQSLLIFVTALTHIMSGGVEGEDAHDPTDLGVETEPLRKREPTTPEQGRARAKIAAKPASAVRPTKDEETPIVVGESARKHRILQKYRELSR
jgi:hypothetical protein